MSSGLDTYDGDSQLDLRVVALRLAVGALVRHTVRNIAWMSFKVVNGELWRLVKGSPKDTTGGEGAKKNSLFATILEIYSPVFRTVRRSLVQEFAEVSFGLLYSPLTYLAGKTVPRFMGEFLFAQVAPSVSSFDFFDPIFFVPFATQAFLMQPGDNWQQHLFTWQVPYLTIETAKIIARRVKFMRQPKSGKDKEDLAPSTTNTRSNTTTIVNPMTTRSLLLLATQIPVKHLIATYSITLPTNAPEVMGVIGLISYDWLVTNYLLETSWP